MDSAELLEPFAKLLGSACTSDTIREIELGGSAQALWSELEASGFLHAMVPEVAGGAGLSLADVAPLLIALGRFAVPLPVGETIIARSLIAGAGLPVPSGPIVLAARGAPRAVPFARVASHALVESDGNFVVAAIAAGRPADTGLYRSLAAHLSFLDEPAGPAFFGQEISFSAIGALVCAAGMAGASDQLLEMTAAYANDRIQFGKPIGRQQAVQQQLAVMAEQVVMTRMAAQIGLAGGLSANRATATVAKAVASRAAAQIADIAHAVHGAIGISEEHSLQLYTRRLREWRLAFGSERFWSADLGRNRLAAAQVKSSEFIRTMRLAGGA